MRSRKGFRNFIRKLEGVPPSVDNKHYELPSELPQLPLKDVVWREVDHGTDNYWLLNAFLWRDSLGGQTFWEAIVGNYAREEDYDLANRYIQSWSEQSYV